MGDLERQQEMLEKLQEMKKEVQTAPKVEKVVTLSNMDDVTESIASDLKPASVISENNDDMVSKDNKDSAYNDIEVEAMSHGWVPKDRYHGVESDFVDADLFMRRGATFRRIEALKNKVEQESVENKNLREMVKSLVSDIRTAEDNARKRFLEQLAEQKQEAKDAGNLDIYLAAEEQEKQYIGNPSEMSGRTAATIQQSDPTATPEFKAFAAKHPFVDRIKSGTETDDDIERHAFAMAKLDRYVRANPTVSQKDQLDYADKVLSERFNVDNKVVSKTSSPGIPSSSERRTAGQNSEKVSLNELSPSQKLIYDNLKFSPKQYGMTAEEYLKIVAKQRATSKTIR